MDLSFFWRRRQSRGTLKSEMKRFVYESETKGFVCDEIHF
jgi:hypothetical protein